MSERVERVAGVLAKSRCAQGGRDCLGVDPECVCIDDARAAIAAMSDLPWEIWYHKEHADLCALEAKNYVLKQRIKALEALLAEQTDIKRLWKVAAQGPQDA